MLQLINQYILHGVWPVPQNIIAYVKLLISVVILVYLFNFGMFSASIYNLMQY